MNRIVSNESIQHNMKRKRQWSLERLFPHAFAPPVIRGESTLCFITQQTANTYNKSSLLQISEEIECLTMGSRRSLTCLDPSVPLWSPSVVPCVLTRILSSHRLHSANHPPSLFITLLSSLLPHLVFIHLLYNFHLCPLHVSFLLLWVISINHPFPLCSLSMMIITCSLSLFHHCHFLLGSFTLFVSPVLVEGYFCIFSPSVELIATVYFTFFPFVTWTHHNVESFSHSKVQPPPSPPHNKPLFPPSPLLTSAFHLASHGFTH